MANAFDVAAYIVAWFGRKPREENDLSSLKLQKLLYYCQGHFLALYGSPLFPEKIEAWEHGPVVSDVYRQSRHVIKGAAVITADKWQQVGGSPDALSSKEKEFIREIIEVRGQFSAWRLRSMTHEEAPWCNAYVEGQKREISTESLQEYFRHFVV